MLHREKLAIRQQSLKNQLSLRSFNELIGDLVSGYLQMSIIEKKIGYYLKMRVTERVF